MLPSEEFNHVNTTQVAGGRTLEGILRAAMASEQQSSRTRESRSRVGFKFGASGHPAVVGFQLRPISSVANDIDIVHIYTYSRYVLLRLASTSRTSLQFYRNLYGAVPAPVIAAQ